jgi:hypothetical protein
MGQPMAVELAPASAIAALAVLFRGEVRVDGDSLSLDRPIGAGARVETAIGEAVIQLDRGSGVALAADTSVRFAILDNHQIQIVLERGVITVLASPRRASEQLAIVSRGRSVVVRGTGFRVARTGATFEVRCDHGRVEVTDGTSARSVGPGQRLQVADRDDLGDAVIATLDGAARAELESALELPLLAVWSDAATALASSSVLALEAGDAAAIEVDGQTLGSASVSLRLAAGRHHIAVAGHPEWGVGKWLTIAAGGETRVQAAGVSTGRSER